MNWYLEVLKKYADFDGRARRTEYWMFALFNFLIGIVLSVVDSVSGLKHMAGDVVSPLNTFYSLAVLLPSLAVGVRRLHDTGRSGWLILVALIPCAGAIILLVWFVSEGEAGSNQYGPDPKGVGRSDRSDRSNDRQYDDE